MKRYLTMLLLIVLLTVLLMIPAQAAELGYVTDEAELLTTAELANLEKLCESAAERYQCGVYIVTVDDYRDYGSGDVFEVTYGIYHDYELGVGPERDGVILLLSMNARDFALFVYGDHAEYAFDDYGQQMLEEQFLPHFGENDWDSGFRAYVQTAGEYLGLAAAGEPVRESNAFLFVIAIAVSFLISLVVCSILKSGMKSVQAKNEASVYVSNALNLTQQVDAFTHTTTVRTKIEKSSSGSRSGGGGSGRSGKF